MARNFVCSETEPIVETKEGKLRGFLLDGIYTFHGIKYANAKRWQMPTPVEPWEGVKDATNYGYICPINGAPAPQGEIYIPHRFWPANENCQYLNIWTTSLNAAAKKPVMVWLHGGGFSDGSSIEQIAYEGDALAEYGDVVVVTLNHRLNILGYLDMSSYGEKYKNSGNAGMADIVEALRWVHNNIAGFGGDPENVTIFGQSGGGGKVQTLLQIPDAAGLFHRAVLMSGIMSAKGGSGRDQATDHRLLIDGILKELDIPENEVERLEKVPYALLTMAYNKVNISLIRKGIYISWGPVPNDWYLGDPMVVGFSEYAKTVPTMAGTVIAEFSEGAKIPAPDQLTYPEKCRLIQEQYGAYGERMTALFEKAYPDKDLTRLTKLDNVSRLATTRFIEEKARVSTAPAYLYMFALDFDVNGSRPAWHCSDIPFVFHNTHRVPCCNIQGVTEKLEDEMAGAWVSFARYGNPNHKNMDHWPAYQENTKATMIFDRHSQAKSNYDRELMETLEEALPPMDMRASFAERILEREESGEGNKWMY